MGCPWSRADYIEIGVFSGKKDQEKPLYLRKEKFTEGHKTFVITVDQLPTLAGIDPYNKLIDRNANDNIIDCDRAMNDRLHLSDTGSEPSRPSVACIILCFVLLCFILQS
jgi:hypothetical protein